MDNPNDINIGYWVNGLPYTFNTRSTEKSSERIYRKNLNKKDMNKLDKLSDCGTWAGNYFRFIIDNVTLGKYVNGRTYYEEFMKIPEKLEIQKPIPFDQRSQLSFDLEPYSNTFFEMSSLICAQLADTRGDSSKEIWSSLIDTLKKCPPLSKCDPCSTIGYKIAKSLIKIAALRIFAEPEQSIMELPVNSIDAYNPNQKVGKFGMGFFSILYWLIDHPKRYLILDNFTKDTNGKWCTYRTTIQEHNGMLAFKLEMFPESEVTITGVRIELNADQDQFTNSNVEEFTRQANKLKFNKNVNIYIYKLGTSFFLSQKFISDNPLKNIVMVITNQKIIVEDFATGISPEITLGSLFVPSISTKTIQMAERALIFSSTPPSYISDTKLQEADAMAIVVNGIAVVYINNYSSQYGGNINTFVLSLPASTRLPVSRDDVIITSDIEATFIDGITTLLNQSAKTYLSIVNLQSLLQKYIDYTPSTTNRDLVRKALNTYTEVNKSLLVPKDYEYIYNNLSTKNDTKFILSSTYDILSIERLMDTQVDYNDKIWYGLKMVKFTSNKKNIVKCTSGGLYNYIFVSNEYIKSLGVNWIKTITTSFFDMKLYPYGSIDKKEYEKYSKLAILSIQYLLDVDEIIKNMLKGANLITLPMVVEDLDVLTMMYTVLNKYESLDIYFSNVGDDTVMRELASTFCLLYRIFDKKDVVSILMAMLKKFSSFKGNQTYGSNKYLFNFIRPNDLIQYKRWGKNENIGSDWYVEHIIACIFAVKEQDRTNFQIENDNNPYRIYKYFRKYFTSLSEYTQFVAGYGRSLFDQDPYPKQLTENIIQIYIQDSLNKIRKTPLKLLDMYEIWNNKGFQNSSITFMKLINEKVAGGEWFTNILKTNEIKIIPLIKVYFEEYKRSKPTPIKLSSMINHLFKKPLPIKSDKTLVKKHIEELNDFLEDISKAPIIPLKLQIIEIAVNEGTVKPFIDATMTELTQNSIDAIREFKPQNKDIKITLTRDKDNKEVHLTIRDEVGMSPTAFIYIAIPFLSTKSPSELVTGEMGSGFFNVYRESNYVMIDTNKDGYHMKSYDIPIRDDKGRVIDIEKHMKIRYHDEFNINPGTTIEVSIPVKDDFEYASVVGRVDYMAKYVLGLSNHESIFYQGKNIHIPRIYVDTIGHFEIYITDTSNAPQHESFLLTKGVPFSPLTPYLKDLLMDRAIHTIESNVIVNITHGGYTPVQTRTRINLPHAEMTNLAKVAQLVVYAAMLRDVSKGKITYALDHLMSKADATQLKFTLYDIKYQNNLKYYDETSIFKHTSFRNKISLSNMINKCIDIMDTNAFSNDIWNKIIRNSVIKRNQTGNKDIDDMIMRIIKMWLEPKNLNMQKYKAEKLKAKKTGSEEYEMVDPDTYPDQPEPEVKEIVKKWITLFWKIARQNNIIGFGTPPLAKAVYSVKQASLSGWYDPKDHSITINTYHWDDNHRDSLFKILKNPTDKNINDKLKNNNVWKSVFAYGFPSSTLIHEIEHTRRKDDHSAGGHDSITVTLYDGDVVNINRTFDQVANASYQHVLAHGFLQQFLN